MRIELIEKVKNANPFKFEETRNFSEEGVALNTIHEILARAGDGFSMLELGKYEMEVAQLCATTLKGQVAVTATLDDSGELRIDMRELED